MSLVGTHTDCAVNLILSVGLAVHVASPLNNTTHSCSCGMTHNKISCYAYNAAASSSCIVIFQLRLMWHCAGPVAEQVLLLENIGTSVLVGPEQLPSLHRLLLIAARTLQMDPPDLYIKQVIAVLMKLMIPMQTTWC